VKNSLKKISVTLRAQVLFLSTANYNKPWTKVKQWTLLPDIASQTAIPDWLRLFFVVVNLVWLFMQSKLCHHNFFWI